MALIITVAQQKGGAGKTTLVANLATVWARAHRVAAIDMDPQRSLARWGSLRGDRGGVEVAECAGWRLSTEVDRLSRHHDLILVDSPPQIDQDARRAVRSASLVLVPVQPSPPDIWAAEGTLRIVAEERRRAAIVLNRVPTAPKLRQTADREPQSRGLTPIAALGNRAVFTQAFAEGLGVGEASPRSVAATEMSALAEAIWARLHGNG